MLLDELRLGTIVCTTALEVKLLAALVAERRHNSRLPKLRPKPKPQPVEVQTPVVCAPEPTPEPVDFIGPPEMYGPWPMGPGWGAASHATILDIQMAVAKEWKVTVEDIKSQRRTKDIVGPRHVAVMLCTVLTANSLPKLGRQFGARDHSTMLHSKLKYDWMRIELINTLSAGEPLRKWAHTAHKLWLGKATDDNPAFISSTQRKRALEFWHKRKQQEAANVQGNAQVDADVLEGLSGRHQPSQCD